MTGEKWQEDEGQDIAEILRTVRPKRETAIELVREMRGEGENAKAADILTFSERIIARERLESPARAHTLHSVQSVIDYLMRYDTEHTVILADIPGRQMTIILDENAARGVERLTFVPQVHPLFAPWELAAQRGPGPIGEFARFIMENRRSIVAPEGKQLAALLSQVRASTKVTMERGKGRRAVNGVMIETEIMGQVAKEPIEIPDTITILTPLFIDANPIEIEVDLVVYAEGGPAETQVIVNVSIPDLGQLRLNAFDHMLRTIKANAGSEITVVLGAEQRVEWPRV